MKTYISPEHSLNLAAQYDELHYEGKPAKTSRSIGTNLATSLACTADSPPNEALP